MKVVVEVYTILWILLLTMSTGLSVTMAEERAAQAKRVKAEVVAEIENSKFNPAVIDACKSSVRASGIDLSVTPCTYDQAHDVTSAEVVLTYTYKIPLLGIEQTRTTEGIAR